ncbi:hypothetical protein CEXT_228781 [Caerostris extrusa]|uniref:Secreted protein n=1 Tax=Caerostris extrusa TaxID=172846 RepID=A0AAV4SA01_CAEEX|nr:hypothetical protein CEXT_228781 [Caerostris extrusa]
MEVLFRLKSVIGWLTLYILAARDEVLAINKEDYYIKVFGTGKAFHKSDRHQDRQLEFRPTFLIPHVIFRCPRNNPEGTDISRTPLMNLAMNKVS